MFKKIGKIFVIAIISVAWVGILLFLFYLDINTASIKYFIGTSISKASSNATLNKAVVLENPINKLALELNKKEKELNRYEEILVEREKDLVSRDNPLKNKLLMLIIFLMKVVYVLYITSSLKTLLVMQLQ